MLHLRVEIIPEGSFEKDGVLRNHRDPFAQAP